MAHGCRLYTFGGFDLDGGVVNAAQAFNVTTGRWIEVPARQEAAANSAAVELGGKIYLIGGYDDTRPEGEKWRDTVEVYDIATRSWALAAPLPQPTSGMTAAVLGGRIYALGGNTLAGDWPHAAIYDPASDAWSAGPDLPTNTPSFAQAAVVAGRLYLAGGWHVLLADNCWGTNFPMWIEGPAGYRFDVATSLPPRAR